MNREGREHALSEIRENIARSGYHLYVVAGGMEPRFAYTIGLSPNIGKELILAGAMIYLYEDVAQIIEQAAEMLISYPMSERSEQRIDPYGSFTFRHAHPSWAIALVLGALDYYQKPEIAALQIVPDKEHWTVDVPNMSTAWSPDVSPVWRWLKEPWSYRVPASSYAVTDLDALRGAAVTEACRWEEDYWELFAGAGPEVPAEQRRVVPLGTLLGADPSLLPVLDLPVGEGIWRKQHSEWHMWQTAQQRSGSSD
jgi:hypothetical protein